LEASRLLVLPVTARRWVLADNTFWHAGGTIFIDFIIIIDTVFIDFIITIDFVNRGWRNGKRQPNHL
jgi:hypothetical protein